MAKQVDWAAVRALFPAAEKYVYLNTGSGGCMSVYAAEAAKRYYDESVAHADLHWNDWLATIEETRHKLATRWGAEASEIGFVGSLSVAMNAAAAMFASDRREVLAMADEFPSVTLPWLQRGYPVRFLESDENGRVPLDKIANALTADTRYLLTSSVQYSTGFRQDLVGLGRLCAEREVLLIVDATQQFGALPLRVDESNIAVLAASTYKWTTAGYGVAPLYVRQDLIEQYGLPLVGWRSNAGADKMVNDQTNFTLNAMSVEAGHPPIAGALALSGALRLFDEVGEAAVAARIGELTDYLHRLLDEAGLPIVSPRDRAERAGITIVAVEQNERVATQLRERNIFVAPRGKGLRVAVHLYNNEADVEAFVTALKGILIEETAVSA